MMNRLIGMLSLLIIGCASNGLPTKPVPSTSAAPVRNDIEERMKETQAKEINDPEIKRGRAIPQSTVYCFAQINGSDSACMEELASCQEVRRIRQEEYDRRNVAYVARECAPHSGPVFCVRFGDDDVTSMYKRCYLTQERCIDFQNSLQPPNHIDAAHADSECKPEP